MAAKFLKSSVPLSDTTYNWWQSDYGVVGDYGPRLDDSLYRDFGTGGTGTPEGAANKYYIMTKPEWDFDQIYTLHTDSLPQDWLAPPPTVAFDISNGMDSRFLLSIGRFDLPPDSSVRILFTTFTGAQVHRDPQIMDFLPYYPDFYRWSLNFNDVRAVAHAADSLAELLTDPLGPVAGLEVVRHGPDSAVVTWDPQVFDNIDGYDICVREVDPAQLPFPGTPPPWLTPESLTVYRSVAPGRQHILDTMLNPDRFYLINVVMRSSAGQGDAGLTAIHRPVARSQPPTPDSRYVFFAPGNTVTIEWQPPDDNPVDHYNIYRLESFGDTVTLYHPFYDRGLARDRLIPADSVQVDGTTWYYYALAPLAVVNGDETSFTDAIPADSSCYVVTSVNPAGFESRFSSPALLFSAPARDRDVLVLTKSPAGSYFGSPDSVAAFYDAVLDGLSYDVYAFADSAIRPLDWPWWLDLMPYRLVIVDDDLRDLVFRQAPLPTMLNYLNSGGQLLVCGSLFEYSLSSLTLRTAEWHRADSIGTSTLGVDSLFAIGLRYYQTYTLPPYVDSVGGFIFAERTDPALPGLPFDTTRNPFLPGTTTYWPPNTAPIVAGFAPDSGSTTVYRYRSRYPGLSYMEGMPVGIRRAHGPGAIYTFGFHLWYLVPDSVRTLVSALLDRVPTEIEDEDDNNLPSGFSLSPNFPNPFNPTTTISYALPSACRVKLEIFNLLGQRVRTLRDMVQGAGRYEVVWDGNTDGGHIAASGIYFYRLTAGDVHFSRKMLLVK